MFRLRFHHLFQWTIVFIILVSAQLVFAQQQPYPGKTSWWDDSIRHIGNRPDQRQRLWFTASESGDYRIKIWWGQDIDPDGTRPFDCDTGECQTGEIGHVTLNGTTPSSAIYNIPDGRLGWYLGYREIEKSLSANDEVYSIYGSMEHSINVYIEVERIEAPAGTPTPPVMPSFSCVIPNSIGLDWGHYYLHEVTPANRIVHVKHEGIVISPLDYAQDWENDGLPHPILDETGVILATFYIEYHYDQSGNVGYVDCYLPQPDDEQSDNTPSVGTQPNAIQPQSVTSAPEPVATRIPVSMPYVCANAETIVSTAFDPQLYQQVSTSADAQNQRQWELVRYNVLTQEDEQVVVVDNILTENAQYDELNFKDVVSLEPNHNCIIATVASPKFPAAEQVMRGKIYFMDYGGNLLSTLEGEQYDYVHVEWTANYTVIAVRREQQPDGRWSQPRAYLTDRMGSFWVPLGTGTAHQSIINAQTDEPIIAYTTPHHTLAFMTLIHNQVDRSWDTGLTSDRAEWMPDGTGLFVKSGEQYHVLTFNSESDTLFSESIQAIDLAVDPENDGDVIVSSPFTDSTLPLPNMRKLTLNVDPVASPINSDWVDPLDGIYSANPTPLFNFLNAMQVVQQPPQITRIDYMADSWVVA